MFIKKASREAGSQYPEPGSNRHGLLHWCLLTDKPSASKRKPQNRIVDSAASTLSRGRTGTDCSTGV